MQSATLSEDAVALCEIDSVLANLNKERKELDTKIACMELARTLILTDIRRVSNLPVQGHFYGNA